MHALKGMLVAFSFIFTQAMAITDITTFEIEREIAGDNQNPIQYYLEESSNEATADTLVVFFQGSDCNSVKHNQLIRSLSSAILPHADLLLIEKPGITASLSYTSNAERTDCPSFYLQHDSLEQRASDAHIVLTHVLTYQGYERVVVMGGSEGAAVAGVFAAEFGMADAVVMFNGGGRWFLQDVEHNIISTTPESETEFVLEGFRAFTQQVLTNEPFDIEVSNHGYHWWRSALELDLKAVLYQLNIPALIVQGGRDLSVSPNAVKAMHSELVALNKNNIELLLVDDMDHSFFDSGGDRMTDDIAKQIRSWLLEHSL